MSGNMRIYDAVRAVPEEAKRAITAGRLKGKTDINPMWRIKALTEQFGPCGDGWGYTIDRLWIEEGAKGEKCAFAMISLWYRQDDGMRSDPVIGIGGNMLVANEKNGLYTSDECYKMALTDAISVACKALGFGADVYWGADRTKYTPQQEPQKPQKPPLICVSCHNAISGISTTNAKKSAEEVAEFTRRECGADLCYACYKAWKAEGMA